MYGNRSPTSFLRVIFLNQCSSPLLPQLKLSITVLEITVGHRTLSDQILKMPGQFHIMIGHDDRSCVTSTSWVFFKVLSVNKLCPIQFVKCPTKRKIWKDICPLNKEKLFPALVLFNIQMDSNKSIGPYSVPVLLLNILKAHIAPLLSSLQLFAQWPSLWMVARLLVTLYWYRPHCFYHVNCWQL